MKRSLWLVAGLIALTALVVGGCHTQPTPPPLGTQEAADIVEGPSWFPENDKNFRPLTDSEKDRVVEIALNSSSASEWLRGRTDYRVGPVDWYAIIWSNSEPGTWWALDYDVVEKGVPFFVSKETRWYPGVTIAVREGTITQMQIAVDIEAGKTVMVDGPYPSLSSPDRFRSLPRPQNQN